MMKTALLTFLCGVMAATAALAQPSSQTSTSPSAAQPRPDKAAQDDLMRRLAPGTPVVDPRGVVVGEFQAWARGAAMPMAVLEVDGKLVSVPQNTLRVLSGRVVSSQTKPEILAAADVPR